MLLAVGIGLSALAVVAVFVEGSCGTDRLWIESDIGAHGGDPEACEALQHRIEEFNDACGPAIEPLDCG